MTDSLHQDPLGVSKVPPFDLPTGEGAPSKIEGVGGVFWRGSRGKFPLVGLGKAQGLRGFGARPNKLYLGTKYEACQPSVMLIYSETRQPSIRHYSN